MSSFFPMPRGDRWYLATLVGIAVVAFLPWSRTTTLGVLPVFGWMMAALMVVAPLAALARLLLGRRRGGSVAGAPRTRRGAE